MPLLSAALAVATCVLPGASAALGSVTSAASPASLYAYAAGAAGSSSCPKTDQRSRQCGLAQALSRVKPGGSVLLATRGKSGTYYGNFVIGTRHTSAGKPVTIGPAPGVRNPVINGDAAGQVTCPTKACDGSVLTVRAGVVANLRSLTITGGHNTNSRGGGGIDDLGTVNLTGVTITNCSALVGGGVVVGKGARLTVAHSVLSNDRSNFFGGAIDNGSVIAKVVGSGRLTVTDSVFTGDRSQRGGAIDNGNGGTGTATIARSTFSHDSASDHGGAIDNADSGHGTLTVTDSTFSHDTAKFGGAIDNADSDGRGTLTVARSTFFQDSAVHGGAIDNGERGNGAVTVRTSTFHADKARAQGSAVDSGDAGGTGTVVILKSTIDGNLGTSAIARIGGSVAMAGSILAGSRASCSRAIADAGYNLIDNRRSNCGFSIGNTDLIGVNPKLRSLARAGGPTATMVPTSASPVLEQIPNPAVAQIGPGNRTVELCPQPDQRGIRRTEAVGCAIGSVDPATSIPVVTSLSPSLGLAKGGGTVVIHGAHFARRAVVSFGAVKSAHVTVVSAAKIKATIPALPSSSSSVTVRVTVKNPSGPLSPYRAAAIYSYYTPDWSAYLGGANHSSYNPGTTSISSSSMPNLQPVWQWHPSGLGLPDSTPEGTTTDDASPIAYKGVIYVGLEDGYMEAISESTGQLIWPAKKVFLGIENGSSHSCGSAAFGIISTATVATDPVTGKPIVYVNAPDGHLYALDAATGNVLWKSVVGIPSKILDDFYAWGSPTVANGKVYIGIASNCDVPLVKAGVLSFNQHTGKKIAYWDSLPPSLVGASVWSSVAVLPNGDVVNTTGNAQADHNIPDSESINVLNGSTLKLIGTWEAPQKQAFGDSDFGASPTVFTAYPHGVATTMVGACNKDGVYYALRANDMGAGPLWTYRMGIATSGELNNECDAAAIWNGKYLIEGGGSQVTINGTSYEGSVQALNPTTGKPIWRTGLTGWIVGSPSENGAGVIAAPVFFSQEGVSGVYLLSATTGKILKFINTEPNGQFAQPVWDGNKLLVGDESSNMPLTAYAVTKSTQTAPLGVSPGSVTPGSIVTLTLTATGGEGFTSAPNVIISGREAVVQSVQVMNSTTLQVTVDVLNDAIAGAALDVTATLPDLTAYTCTSCLAVS